MGDQPFEATIALRGNVADVRLVGELDVLNVPCLKRVIQEVWEAQPAVVVLDLSELHYVDMRGIDALCEISRASRARGMTVQVRHHSRAVERLAELLQLSEDVIFAQVLGA